MAKINQEQSVALPSVSRKSATIANLVYQYVAIGLTFVNGIVLVPLYLKYIDFHLYGAWLATGSIVAWLGMVDAGLSEIIRQKTAKVYGAHEIEQAGPVIGTGVFCNSMMGLLPGIITVISAPWVVMMFHFTGDSAIALSRSFALAGLSVTMVVIAGAASSVLQGLQRNISVCVIFTSTALISIGLTVYLLVQGFGVLSIPLGLLVRNLMAGVLYWGYMIYVCRYRMGFRLNVSVPLMREIIGLTGWTFLYKASFEIIAQCDALLIGLILGVETTPVYVLTRRIWDILRQFLSRIGVAFMPGLAHLYGQHRIEVFNAIALRLLRTVVYISLWGVGVCLVMNRSFVSLWVGQSLHAGRLFDLLAAVMLMMEMYIWTMNQVLYAAGHIRQPAIAGLFQNLLRLALLLLLIYPFGILGVAASIPLSILIVGFPYFLQQWKKWLALSAMQVGAELLSAIAKAVLVAVAAYLIGGRMATAGWMDFAAKTALVGMVFGAGILVMDVQCRRDIGFGLKRVFKK